MLYNTDTEDLFHIQTSIWQNLML